MKKMQISSRLISFIKFQKFAAFPAAIFLLFLSTQLQAQYPWVQQVSGLETNLVAVSFVDSELGYIATEDGGILISEDRGFHWNFLSHVDDITPTRMVFTDRLRGWLCGNYELGEDSAAVFHTIDGGVSWQPVFQQSGLQLYDVQFLNHTTGWLAGCHIAGSDTLSAMYYTTSEGESWVIPDSPLVMSSLYSIHFRDGDYGESCGQDGLFFQTNNGGMEELLGWSLEISIPAYGKDLFRIFNSGDDYGCAVGEDGIMLATKNKWQDHEEFYLAGGEALNAVTGFSGSAQFYAVGDHGAVAWVRYAIFMWMVSEETRVTGERLNDVCQVDDQFAWAVGDKGTILFHTNNYAPVAVDDRASVRQDSSVQIFVLENDTDADSDQLGIYSYIAGKHGAVMHDGESAYLEFFPASDYVGMDTILYMVTDQKGGIDTGQVYIEIREAPRPPFTRMEIPHDTVAFGNAIWGDIDRDDDYDFILSGEKADGTNYSAVYFNEAGSFIKAPDLPQGLRPGNDHAMAFTDLNGDGYLDFIITGENNSGSPATHLYIFNSLTGKYTEREITVPGVMNGSVDWGDFDHDGDPDLLLMGMSESGKIMGVYENMGRPLSSEPWEFEKYNKAFYGLDHGAAKFIDFNHDLYLDVISNGTASDGTPKTYYYTNLEGSYVTQELTGYMHSSIDACDFNADGSWDFLFTGTKDDAKSYATLLSFTDTFTELASSLSGVSLASASWGDYDNDGDYDLVVCGLNDMLASETRLYNNHEGELENSGYFFPGMASGTVEWGDYDADGDLDLLMSGYFDSEPKRITTIFRNDLEIANAAPEAPELFSVEERGDFLALQWSRGLDPESPSENLDYNIRLREKRTQKKVLSPASGDSPLSLIPGYANARDTLILLSGLNPGALYECEIQAVDACFQVSGPAKFEFTAPSLFFGEQDIVIDGEMITAAEYFFAEDDTLASLLLAQANQSNASILQWEGSDFDILDENFHVAGNFGRVALLDFNMDNELDFSKYDERDSVLLVYISGGETLRVAAGFSDAVYDWGDYDGDGDPDLVISGNTNEWVHFSKLYRNEGDELVPVGVSIWGVSGGDIAWVDIDGDDDMDIFVTGYNMEHGYITRMYENRDGVMLGKDMGLPALFYSSFDFADYTGDGDMDILLCGLSEDGPLAKIYSNHEGVFHETTHGLDHMMQGECKWVDLFKDGVDDIVLFGNPDENLAEDSYEAIVYVYFDGSYTEVARMKDLPGPVFTAGDYDGDGAIDLLFAGQTGTGPSMSIWRNLSKHNLESPPPPRNLSVLTWGDSARLVWDEPLWTGLPRERVMYNLRAGSSPGATDILSPLADETGRRKVFLPGNVPFGTSRTLHGLSRDSMYYVAVQAVDPAFFGSAFTGELAFNPLTGTLIPAGACTSHKPVNAAWVDIDSDSDPDLVMNNASSIISFNNSGSTVEFDSPMQHIQSDFTQDLLVNDYDNDNDADILLLGRADPAQNRMLVNNAGSYTETPFDISGLYKSNAAMGDLNSDGRMDAVIMGQVELNVTLASRIYLQNENGFESVANQLEPTFNGEIHILNLDWDGMPDLVHAGHTESMYLTPDDIKILIEMNEYGEFTPQNHNIPGLNFVNIDFGDYDRDGDPDMLYSGRDPGTLEPQTFVLKNTLGYFEVADTLHGVFDACGKWFDYNNDGKLDIILSGYDSVSDDMLEPEHSKFSGVFLNLDGNFELAARLPLFDDPVLAIADYDSDGRQDVFVGGRNQTGDTVGILLRNMCSDINAPPPAPIVYDAIDEDDAMLLSWNGDYDTDVNDYKLAYNLRVGTSPGSGDIVSPLSHADGTRIVHNRGNMQHVANYWITGLNPSTTYYWAVQAIDKGMAPSVWSEEQSFTTVDVEEQRALSSRLEMDVYPVPAKQEVFVQLRNTEAGEVSLEVFDLNGRLITSRSREAPGTELTFRLNFPQPGLYLARVRSGNKQIVRKILVVE